MNRFENILYSIAWVAIGFFIAFASEWTLWFFGPKNGWFYQLLVGLTLMYTGFFTSEPGFEKRALLLPNLHYMFFGVSSVVIGVMVVTNFNRYEEALSLFGVWLLYALGGIIIFNGVSSLVHYLTVFDRDPPKKESVKTE